MPNAERVIPRVHRPDDDNIYFHILLHEPVTMWDPINYKEVTSQEWTYEVPEGSAAIGEVSPSFSYRPNKPTENNIEEIFTPISHKVKMLAQTRTSILADWEVTSQDFAPQHFSNLQTSHFPLMFGIYPSGRPDAPGAVGPDGDVDGGGVVPVSGGVGVWREAGVGLGLSVGSVVDFGVDSGVGFGRVMQLDVEGSYALPVVGGQHAVGIMSGEVFEEVEVQYCPVGVSVSDCYGVRDPSTGDLLYLKKAELQRNQCWDFPPGFQVLLGSDGVFMGEPLVSGSFRVTVLASAVGDVVSFVREDFFLLIAPEYSGDDVVFTSPSTVMVSIPVVGFPPERVRLSSAYQGVGDQITAPVFSYSGSLPVGVSLSPSGLLSVGSEAMLVWGLTFVVKSEVRVYDSYHHVTDSKWGTREITLHIVKDEFTGPARMMFTTPNTLPQGRVGTEYRETVGGRAFQFEAQGAFMFFYTTDLPPGMKFISTGGFLIGTPTKAGVYTFTIEAQKTDIAGNNYKTKRTFTLTIN